MVGLGHELLEQGESEAAASLARRALAASPRCRPAWLLLAKCFVADRQYAAALVALNVVPTPPMPAAEVELLHVVPPPAPKATTQPQVCGAGNPAVCLRQLAKVSCMLSTCAASVASNSLNDVQGRLRPTASLANVQVPLLGLSHEGTPPEAFAAVQRSQTEGSQTGHSRPALASSSQQTHFPSLLPAPLLAGASV